MIFCMGVSFFFTNLVNAEAEKYKLQAELTPTITTASAPSTGYGLSVKKNGNFVFVVAPATLPTAAGAVYVYKKKGSKWVHTQTIVGEDFNILGGIQVDSQGDWLVISHIGAIDNTLTLQGAVEIYHLNRKTSQWEHTQRLDSTTPGLEELSTISPNDMFPPITQQFEHGAFFGFFFSLDAENGHLLVCAQYQQNSDSHGNILINAGAVYAFDLHKKKATWEFAQKIVNPFRVKSNDTFGANVALKGNIALISTGSVVFVPKQKSASVYVFYHDGKQWQFSQRIRGDQGGFSTMPDTVNPSAMATMFDPGHMITTLSEAPPVIPASAAFGAALAVNHDWAIVTAPLENRSSKHKLAGATYFYRIYTEHDGKKKLHRVKKVFSDDPASNLTGLLHVAIKNDTVLIPDTGRTGPKGERQGGIMVFRLEDGKWKQTKVIYDPNGEAFGLFGEGVSLTKKYIVGGTDTLLWPILANTYFSIPPVIPLPPQPSKTLIFKRVSK